VTVTMNAINLDNVEDRCLNNLLLHQARSNGDSVWLMDGDDHLTFEAAHTAVDAYAAGLSALGIGAGAVVTVMLDSGTTYVLVVLALIRLGAIHIPINTAFKGEFLHRILEHAQPSAVIVADAYAEQMQRAGRGTLHGPVIVVGDIAAYDAGGRTVSLTDAYQPGGRVPALDATYRDVVAISYTSGTTGRSKGVVQTHNYWISATQAMSSGRDIRSDDVFHSCTPMFHAGAWLLNIYPSLMYGRPLGVERWFSVRDFWPSVRRYGATQLFTLGAMHMWLWGEPPEPEDGATTARIWTAVPIASDLVGPFADRFGLDGVYSAYGQTEIMPAAIADVRRTWKPGSCGVAQPNLELRVFDEHDLEVPAGEVGELVCRPRQPETMFREYFKMPGETAVAFRNLWYHTGDLVRIDSDGEVFFVDRKADYLRRRGENISSLEVEEVIRLHAAVADVAAYGVPSVDGEDEMKVSIVLEEGALLDPTDLACYCAENLPYFAVPRYIEMTSELPRTPTGRVQKFLLRERAFTAETVDLVAEGFDARQHVALA
jgi:crotonobetaine/carnitine-CoA ligase